MDESATRGFPLTALLHVSMFRVLSRGSAGGSSQDCIGPIDNINSSRGPIER